MRYLFRAAIADLLAEQKMAILSAASIITSRGKNKFCTTLLALLKSSIRVLSRPTGVVTYNVALLDLALSIALKPLE